MNEDPPTSTLPPRPNGEGPGTAMPAMVPIRERDLWLTRRRALIQELEAINRYLDIDKRPARLNDGDNVLE